MAKHEDGNGLPTSTQKRARVLKKARERTARELTKRSIDLTTGSPRATMVAAVAVAAVLPLADASNLLDGLTNATSLQILEADDKAQLAPCKRRCGGG